MLKKTFFVVLLSLCTLWISHTHSLSIVPKGWQQKLDPIKPAFHNMGVKIIYFSTYFQLNTVEMHVQNVLHAMENTGGAITEEAVDIAMDKTMGNIQVGHQDAFEKRMVKEALLSLLNKYGDKIITEKPKAYDEKFHEIVRSNMGCNGEITDTALSACIDDALTEIKIFGKKHNIPTCQNLSNTHLLESDVEACYKDFLDTMRCHEKNPGQCLEMLQRKIHKHAGQQCPDAFEKHATIINVNNCIDTVCGPSDGIIRFAKHNLCQIKFAFT